MKYIAAVLFASLSFSTFAQSQSNYAVGQSSKQANDSTSISSTGDGTLGAPPTPPANCNSTVATWTAGGNTCSGTLNGTYNGQYSQAVSTADGFIGAASYYCSGGSFIASGTPSCVVNSGSGGSGQTQFYTLTENDGSTANMKVPFAATEIDITLSNTVAPQWGGDWAFFQDGWPYITYNHLVTVTSATGTVLQQTTFAQLGRTPMLRETNHGGGCFNTNGSTGGGCGYIKWFGQTSVFFDSARGYGGQNLTGGYTQTGIWGGAGNYKGTYFPQLDSSQSGTVKITNVPAGATLDIHTIMSLEFLNPPSGVTVVSSPSQVTGSYTYAGQSNATNVAAQNDGNVGCNNGDQRYCQAFRIQNQGSWEKDYGIKIVGTSINPQNATSCPPFTLQGTYTNGSSCTASFPKENIGVVDELDCTITTNGNPSTRSNYSTCQADGTQSPVSQVDH